MHIENTKVLVSVNEVGLALNGSKLLGDLELNIFCGLLYKKAMFLTADLPVAEWPSRDAPIIDFPYSKDALDRMSAAISAERTARREKNEPARQAAPFDSPHEAANLFRSSVQARLDALSYRNRRARLSVITNDT